MLTKDLRLPLRSFDEDIEYDFDIYSLTSPVVIDWITGIWKSENKELIDFVLKSLKSNRQYKEHYDELIIQISRNEKDMLGLHVHAFQENTEKILMILTKEQDNEGKYKLVIENVFFENIHELPLHDETFFGPSFGLISNRNRHELEAVGFNVSYSNEEGGMDGGGPGRNWIEKMLYAMADPKRHFLKKHGVKNQLVPDVGVDTEIFFALGRLIGKAFWINAGLPFAFHPKWLQIMIEPQNTEFIENCFNDFYQEELGMLDGLLTYIERGNLEDIWERKFALPKEWRLTTDKSVRNFMIFNAPNVNEPFQPTTGKEIEDFVSTAKVRAFSEFKAAISSFLEGLEIYVNTALFSFIPTPILESLFCPSPDIDVDALLNAFNLEKAIGLTVEISEEDLENIDDDVPVLGPNPFRIFFIDAFKIAVKRLQPLGLLPGFLGQITGARSVGFSNFYPDMFVLIISIKNSSRVLFGEETFAGEKVELPTASSWYNHAFCNKFNAFYFLATKAYRCRFTKHSRKCVMLLNYSPAPQTISSLIKYSSVCRSPHRFI